MGLLTDEEAVRAFINNTCDRNWEVNASMSIDEQTAKSVARELRTFRSIEVGDEIQREG